LSKFADRCPFCARHSARRHHRCVEDGLWCPGDVRLAARPKWRPQPEQAAACRGCGAPLTRRARLHSALTAGLLGSLGLTAAFLALFGSGLLLLLRDPASTPRTEAAPPQALGLIARSEVAAERAESAVAPGTTGLTTGLAPTVDASAAPAPQFGVRDDWPQGSGVPRHLSGALTPGSAPAGLAVAPTVPTVPTALPTPPAGPRPTATVTNVATPSSAIAAQPTEPPNASVPAPPRPKLSLSLKMPPDWLTAPLLFGQPSSQR
jgi:hypothetical protein